MSTIAEETVTATIANNWSFQDTKIEVKRLPITPGDPLTWFLQGSRQHPIPAIVYKVGERNISVMLLSPDRLGNVVDSVYHIDDPRLEESPPLKLNSGAWDYTTQHKKALTREKIMDERLNMLVKRVEELEEALSKPETAKGKKQ